MGSFVRVVVVSIHHSALCSHLTRKRVPLMLGRWSATARVAAPPTPAAGEQGGGARHHPPGTVAGGQVQGFPPPHRAGAGTTAASPMAGAGAPPHPSLADENRPRMPRREPPTLQPLSPLLPPRACVHGRRALCDGRTAGGGAQGEKNKHEHAHSQHPCFTSLSEHPAPRAAALATLAGRGDSLSTVRHWGVGLSSASSPRRGSAACSSGRGGHRWPTRCLTVATGWAPRDRPATAFGRCSPSSAGPRRRRQVALKLRSSDLDARGSSRGGNRPPPATPHL